MFELTTETSFDAAHFLAHHPGQCRYLHGHRWRVVIRLAGERLREDPAESGMLLDFSEAKRILARVAAPFDHSFLYEDGSLRPETVRALEDEGMRLVCLDVRPTAEHLAKLFYDALRAEGLPLRRVDVYETPTNAASYEE